jgi:hypothetical protein
MKPKSVKIVPLNGKSTLQELCPSSKINIFKMVALPEIPELTPWKGLILTSHFDSTLNFEFRASFCQHLSAIVFDLCHHFCKKARLQGFINKFITLEPSETNNRFFFS